MGVSACSDQIAPHTHHGSGAQGATGHALGVVGDSGHPGWGRLPLHPPQKIKKTKKAWMIREMVGVAWDVTATAWDVAVMVRRSATVVLEILKMDIVIYDIM